MLMNSLTGKGGLLGTSQEEMDRYFSGRPKLQEPQVGDIAKIKGVSYEVIWIYADGKLLIEPTTKQRMR